MYKMNNELSETKLPNLIREQGTKLFKGKRVLPDFWKINSKGYIPPPSTPKR